MQAKSDTSQLVAAVLLPRLRLPKTALQVVALAAKADLANHLLLKIKSKFNPHIAKSSLQNYYRAFFFSTTTVSTQFPHYRCQPQSRTGLRQIRLIQRQARCTQRSLRVK